MSPVRDKRHFRMRQLYLAALDALLLRGLVAKWSYHCGLHGRLRVTSHQIQISGGVPLPAPLVIAFASDFHAGPTTHPELFSRLIDEIVAQQPDVVLLGGDYVSSRAEYVDILITHFAKLQPPMGTFAVLGNHDWWTDDERIVRALQSAGINVLINRNCALKPPFDSVSICGFDDPWTGSADAAATFAGAGPIRIFLTHSPDGLLLLDKEKFDVAFAGHTHGGQVAFRDGTQILTAGGPLSRTYGRGRFEIKDNGSLIVSLGVGCSNVPIRINANPELTICTLVSA